MDFIEAKEYIVNRLVNELPKDLFYHGAHHTFAVVKSINRLAVNEKINKHEYNLLQTAAYFHDAGFLYQYRKNEPIAMKMVQEQLPKFDYAKEEIETITNIISATQSHVEPQNILEEIMCDADHDYFGTQKYYTISNTLRKELEAKKFIYLDKEWLELQYDYLSNKHVYYTQTAIETRRPQKQKIIKEIANKLKLK